MRTLWLHADCASIEVIDQRLLPHRFATLRVFDTASAVSCIRDMAVRGAPLIGVTGAWGCWLAMREVRANLGAKLGATAVASEWRSAFQSLAQQIRAARPTAVNLAWAVDQQLAVAAACTTPAAAESALRAHAESLTEADGSACAAIGQHGLELIRAIHQAKRGATVNILTHCNAGWLACIDHGTATAPIYAAHAAGIPVHVWVDETRPRNQGAKLTAWELGQQGVPHTLIPDNAGGHLMQHGMVDLCIVGADRVAANGDAANKIGTYLKALAAFDNHIPFHVALPTSTIDHAIADGVRDIPIESRGEEEVRCMEGLCADGELREVLLCPPTTRAANFGFDVTPARLITSFITERGVVPATKEGVFHVR